ncbi:MAG: hypothetical protein WB660_16355 [Candidatus Sulfotelmatobacter sp.]
MNQNIRKHRCLVSLFVLLGAQVEAVVGSAELVRSGAKVAKVLSSEL